MIAQIQAQRRTECGDETWNPKVEKPTSAGNKCAVKVGGSGTDKDNYKPIGDTVVPLSLGKAAEKDADGLTRDADGNILVWFDVDHATDKYYPTDGSECWLYLGSADIWDQAATKPS